MPRWVRSLIQDRLKLFAVVLLLARSRDPPMTEHEWLTSHSPLPMLIHLPLKASERKLLLYGVACCRRVWQLLHDARSRQAIEVMERIADGEAEANERSAAYAEALQTDRRQYVREHAAGKSAARAVCNLVSDEPSGVALAMTIDNNVASPVCHAVSESLVVNVGSWEERQPYYHQEQHNHTHLLRDIFGNPFRPVTLAQTWLAWNDGTVRNLAQAIYDERALPSGHLDAGRLAILADALEDAGCTSADILSHCRNPGPHVRGCWAVDLLLGKE